MTLWSHLLFGIFGIFGLFLFNCMKCIFWPLINNRFIRVLFGFSSMMNHKSGDRTGWDQHHVCAQCEPEVLFSGHNVTQASPVNQSQVYFTIAGWINPFAPDVQKVREADIRGCQPHVVTWNDF